MSAIDPTKPTAGEALTQDVRNNFATAATEITNLQANLGVVQGNVVALSQQVTALQASLVGYGVWNWQATPLDTTSGIVTGGIGINNTDETTATTLFVSYNDVNGTNYWSQLGVMVPGDGFILTAGGDIIRYTVTAGQSDMGSYFTFPVAFITGAGWEPSGGTPLNVQMLFAAKPNP